jgi:hypothetical protein
MGTEFFDLNKIVALGVKSLCDVFAFNMETKDPRKSALTYIFAVRDGAKGHGRGDKKEECNQGLHMISPKRIYLFIGPSCVRFPDNY